MKAFRLILLVSLALQVCLHAEPITALVYSLKKHDDYSNKLRNEVRVFHMDTSAKADFIKTYNYKNDFEVEWVKLGKKLVTIVEFTFIKKKLNGELLTLTHMKTVYSDSEADLPQRIKQIEKVDDYIDHRIVLSDAQVRAPQAK